MDDRRVYRFSIFCFPGVGESRVEKMRDFGAYRYDSISICFDCSLKILIKPC